MTVIKIYLHRNNVPGKLLTQQVPQSEQELAKLATDIKQWAHDLGFQQTGISDTALADDETHLNEWLDAGYHGDMDYMAKHGHKRSRPAELLPGTASIISVRMEYLPDPSADPERVLRDNSLAYVSRYALGRDYHKLMRNRLQKLADKITQHVGPFGYRAYVDSAPVLEKAIAQKAGLGWIGKHSNLINDKTGSWFFLGEIYTDLALPSDDTASNHCGTCTSCITALASPFCVMISASRCSSSLRMTSAVCALR